MEAVCPKCGHVNNGVDPTCALCSTILPDNTAGFRRRIFRPKIHPTHVLASAVALATLGYFVFGAGNWTAPSDQVIETPEVPDEASVARDGSAEAWIMMADFMKEKVRTPGTVSFPKLGDSRTRVTKLPNAAYEVLGFVDFEGEGDKRIRKYYKGRVIQYREGLWKLDAWEMDYWDAMARYFVGL